ncbi:hypothetical protein Tco_1016871 [Tanacetum coccineum]|uniref:Uncharacterized protein n=1 Tax=Tanacetum coccineum TaxID=301880 RepID=A0ABQ5FPV8_9ASTR
MAISVISISSDSSEDSVGTPAGRVILFGTIPTTIPDTTPVITPPATQTDTPITPILDVVLRFYPPVTTIPHGRPYRYHLNGPVHMMTARKRVGPLPTHRLAVRHSADHSSSDSSSEASSDFHSDASSDSSSRHSLSDHSSPDLPSTSAGPSRKRRRSPTTSVPALSPVSRALSPVRADLIPSPKRVKDSGYLADVEVDPREISLRDEMMLLSDALRDRGIDARVVVEAVDRDETETGVRGPVEVRVERVTHPVMPEDIPEPAQEGAVEATYETLGDLVQRFHDHTQAIPVYRIQAIEGVQREQGHRIVGVESAVIALTERIAELERDNKRLRGTTSVESQRVDRLQRGISLISISSDLSEDSVGTPTGRVILFGTIPTTIPDTTPVITLPTTKTDTPVIPTETPIITPTIPPSPDYTPASPDYSPASDSKSDPSEDSSSDHIPPLPDILPFLSSNDDPTDSDTPDTPSSPTHDTPFTEITAST